MDEIWPETMNLSIKKRRKALRMITNMLKVDTQGEVLANKNCTWIEEWAQPWDLNVVHYKYGRMHHSLVNGKRWSRLAFSLGVEGPRPASGLGEQQETDRLTQVHYTTQNGRHEAHQIEEHTVKFGPALQQLRHVQIEQSADYVVSDPLVALCTAALEIDGTATPSTTRMTRFSGRTQRSSGSAKVIEQQALNAAAECVMDSDDATMKGADGEEPRDLL